MSAESRLLSGSDTADILYLDDGKVEPDVPADELAARLHGLSSNTVKLKGLVAGSKTKLRNISLSLLSALQQRGLAGKRRKDLALAMLMALPLTRGAGIEQALGTSIEEVSQLQAAPYRSTP